MIQTIISVHTPKVAGTSFLHQLKQIYGEHQLLLDYQDDPTNPLSIINIDPNFYETTPIRTISPYKIVHGHFHPEKYSKLDNAFRMTFLRHPIDNILSIYNFWSAHENSFWDHPIFKYFKDANLSLPRFAMIPQIRYLYTQTYFGGFDMCQFDFIGDYTQYNQELSRLGRALEISFDLSVRQNITNDYLKSTSATGTHRHTLDEPEYALLAQILKKDIEFYEIYKGR